MSGLQHSVPFTLNATYGVDLTGQLSFGPLSEADLCEIFKDGRALSKLVTKALVHWFPNLREDTVDEQFRVVNMTDDTRWRVKVLTRGGADFAMSLMLGASRQHRAARYLYHWQHDIDGWLVVDNRHMPLLVFAAIPKQWVRPPKHNLSRRRWRDLAKANHMKRWIP